MVCFFQSSVTAASVSLQSPNTATVVFTFLSTSRGVNIEMNNLGLFGVCLGLPVYPVIKTHADSNRFYHIHWSLSWDPSYHAYPTCLYLRDGPMGKLRGRAMCIRREYQPFQGTPSARFIASPSSTPGRPTPMVFS